MLAKKVISMVYKGLTKVTRRCINFWNMPSQICKLIISEKDLAEWKRIEGIDQYIKKRY